MIQVFQRDPYTQYEFVHFPRCYELQGQGCVESAYARRVPLHRELKTLLLDSNTGRFMVHLAADKKLSFSKLKKYTGSAYLRFADLGGTSARKGELTPFRQEFWGLQHIVDREVLSKSWMTTNDGTRTGYVRFEPGLLLCAAHVQVGVVARTVRHAQGEA